MTSTCPIHSETAVLYALALGCRDLRIDDGVEVPSRFSIVDEAMNDESLQQVLKGLRGIQIPLWVIAVVLVLAVLNRIFRFFP